MNEEQNKELESRAKTIRYVITNGRHGSIYG